MESFMEVVAYEGEGGLGTEEHLLLKEREHGKALAAQYLLGMTYTHVIAIIVSIYLQLSYQDTTESPNTVKIYLLRGLCSQ